MILKIILLLTLLAYSIIVSQSFMYILSLKHVQLNLGAGSYTELRKLIDTSMRRNFKYVIYAALFTNLILIIVTFKNPGSLLFITAAIAFFALIADILLTIRGNLPVNDIINTWSPDNYPSNWTEYRTKWFNILQYRQVANITGFITLLMGAVFGSE
jgi:hypothetical protein